MTTNTHQAGVDLTAEFHVFEVIWSPDTLVMYFDGNPIVTYEEPQFPFIQDFANKRENIVLNMAVGGVFFNGMGLNENEIPSTSFLVVDWVKVHRQ